MLSVESAKTACANQLSQIFGASPNSPVIEKGCDCIVSKVSLSDINSKGVLKADQEITNECIGN